MQKEAISAIDAAKSLLENIELWQYPSDLFEVAYRSLAYMISDPSCGDDRGLKIPLPRSILITSGQIIGSIECYGIYKYWSLIILQKHECGVVSLVKYHIAFSYPQTFAKAILMLAHKSSKPASPRR